MNEMGQNKRWVPGGCPSPNSNMSQHAGDSTFGQPEDARQSTLQTRAVILGTKVCYEVAGLYGPPAVRTIGCTAVQGAAVCAGLVR